MAKNNEYLLVRAIQRKVKEIDRDEYINPYKKNMVTYFDKLHKEGIITSSEFIVYLVHYFGAIDIPNSLWKYQDSEMAVMLTDFVKVQADCMKLADSANTYPNMYLAIILSKIGRKRNRSPWFTSYYTELMESLTHYHTVPDIIGLALTPTMRRAIIAYLYEGGYYEEARKLAN